jgi:hypothetical protein
MIFTGRRPKGALSHNSRITDVPPGSYKPEWQWEDVRLPGNLKELLSALLHGDYSDFKKLIFDLNNILTTM